MKDPYSDMKIFKHQDKLRSIEENKITGPIFLRVKPTNMCDHNCYYCYFHNKELEKTVFSRLKPHDFIKWDIFRDAIVDFKDIGGKSITFSGGGEPLIYYKIQEALELSKELDLDVAIITNGQKLNGEKAEILKEASWIRISMDSHNKDLFKRIRGIKEENFNILEDNIRKFVSIKDKSCELGINCVVHEMNIDYLYEISEYVKNLGVDNIKFAPMISKDTEKYQIPHKEIVIAKIKKISKELSDKNFNVIDKYSDQFDLNIKNYRTYDKCPLMQIGAVIAADSCIYTCHDKAYDPLGLIGNLKEKSFKDIWLSKETRKFFQDFNPIEKCKHHCMYDSRNILMNNYFNIDEKSINFI
jgi:wyosine [tRNA(Phe)-imidazoG37] synthetase (radical SAM superfamily)